MRVTKWDDKRAVEQEVNRSTVVGSRRPLLSPLMFIRAGLLLGAAALTVMDSSY